ncbi:MAG: hypothetical protein H6926_06480 [Chromatiales bacterium]|nr:hypothetical protein [Gammaproteobacteria bacterium]MCP5352817.1 hypothetical protein [Chromatiales bacterium]
MVGLHFLLNQPEALQIRKPLQPRLNKQCKQESANEPSTRPPEHQRQNQQREQKQGTTQGRIAPPILFDTCPEQDQLQIVEVMAVRAVLGLDRVTQITARAALTPCPPAP